MCYLARHQAKKLAPFMDKHKDMEMKFRVNGRRQLLDLDQGPMQLSEAWFACVILLRNVKN